MSDTSRHVIHVIPSLETGGMERVVCDLASGRKGETEVICLFSLGELGDQLRSRGVAIHTLRPARSMFSRALSLRQIIRGRRPDVLHCHNLQAFTYGAAASVGSRCKLVLTKHGMRMPKRVTLGERFRIASAKHAELVGVSSEICQLLGNWSSRPRRDIQLIANGLSLSEFHPPEQDRRKRAAARANREMIGVIVARLGPEKDHATLLRAVHQMVRRDDARESNSKLPFELRIVGDGPCRAELEQLCLRLGIQDHVQFLGERHDIAAQLHEADFAVLSSKTEGTPISLLEAMSAGLPVVATKVGGVPDLISNYTTGILVAPEDPLALADAIQKVIQTPELASELGLAASKHIQAQFSIERTIERYESIYASRGCAA